MGQEDKQVFNYVMRYTEKGNKKDKVVHSNPDVKMN